MNFKMIYVEITFKNIMEEFAWIKSYSLKLRLHKSLLLSGYPR